MSDHPRHGLERHAGELVYPKQLRPVLTEDTSVMETLFELPAGPERVTGRGISRQVSRRRREKSPSACWLRGSFVVLTCGS